MNEEPKESLSLSLPVFAATKPNYFALHLVALREGNINNSAAH